MESYVQCAAEEEEGVSKRDLGSHREDVSSNYSDPTSTSVLQLEA